MAESLTFQYDIQIADLGVTLVENSFISLYMPQMPGDVLKVYLFGLRACRAGKPEAVDDALIAESLGLAEADVAAAWQYLKKIGVIDEITDTSGATRIVYQQIAARVLGGELDTPVPDREEPPAAGQGEPDDERQQRIAVMFDKIQTMYGSKPMPKSVMFACRRFLTEYGFEPETVFDLVAHAFDAIEKKGQPFTERQTVSYIEAIAKDWRDRGVVTYQDAETVLRESRERKKAYRDILDYLGVTRKPIGWEAEMMDAWFDDFHFDMAVIKEALSRTTTPNVRYVNGILKRWHENGYKTPDDIKKEQKPRKAKPQPEIEQDPWLSAQYDALEAESMAEMIEKAKGN